MKNLSLLYILENNTPVQCEDAIAWAHWMGTDNKIVRQETVKDYFVSTVFLGVVHSNNNLFETMVFDSRGKDCLMLRGRTWEEAQAMHQEVVSFVKSLKQNK